MNFYIAFVVSLFGLCVTMPLFTRYFALTTFPSWIKVIGFLACILIAILPLFASRDWTKVYGSYFSIIEYTLYFIYIFAVILFFITLLRDIIWMILSICKCIPNPFHAPTLGIVNIITIVLALICSGWSLYEGTKVPEYRHITITNPKITQPTTVVLLSDLHISRTVNPQKISGIIEKTNALNPDLILLAGDIIDDTPNVIKSTTNLLSKLHAKIGTFFVSGNHEFYIGYKHAMQALKNVGCTSIENKKIAIKPNFYIAGVSDIPTTQRFGNASKVTEVLADIPQSAFVLFVSHSPTPLNLPYDLQVSGHTHGGQILPFHLFSWMANHYLLSGFYPSERIYISRGSGQWGPQMRFFAPSEITVLHLIPDAKSDDYSHGTTK